VEFFATTVNGLESIAAAEVRELTGRDAVADVGKVIFRGSTRDAVLLNFASRSLNKVYLTVVHANASTLDEIESQTRQSDFSCLLGPTQSFAVRAERHGAHLLTSPQLAAAVGRAVVESVLQSRRVRPQVDLDNPDVELYALARDTEFFLGINTTGRSLHHRFYRVWRHRAAVLPTVAYAMLKMGGWNIKESCLDPFTGGATIPIEAGLIGRNIAPGLRAPTMPMERLIFFEGSEIAEVRRGLEKEEAKSLRMRITASDVSSISLEGARRNIQAAGLQDSIRLTKGDARFVSRWLDDRPGLIVTNPPFGIRLGLSKPEQLYDEVFREFACAAPDAKLVLLATKEAAVVKALGRNGWRVTGKLRIIYGKLQATLISSRIE